MDCSEPSPEHRLSRDKLLAILRICQSANSERDLGALLDRLAGEAARLVDCDRGSVFLLDRDRSELWSRAATGTEREIRFDSRLGIAGEAATTGRGAVAWLRSPAR